MLIMIKKVKFIDWNFEQAPNCVLYYDPVEKSEFSNYIEFNIKEIKDSFKENRLEFCYIPDLCKSVKTEQIKYRFPNWDNEPLRKLGNDVLKQFFPNNKNIGACFFQRVDCFCDEYYCYELQSLSEMSWDDQFKQFCSELLYENNQYHSNDIRFSVTSGGSGYPVFEQEYCLADVEFDKNNIDTDIKNMICKLKAEGIEQFVLQMMVPINEKLSKVVITPQYDILLPSFGNMPIDMSPLPKALFLLFLKHDEGINFKDLDNYREELQTIYEKITNRVSDSVISDSIAKITNPLDNAINEKCSRIREAFLKRMDERIAEHYYVIGERGEIKKIILPRNLVEWQCEI